MLVVVSPAKKLDMLPVDNIEPTHPLFGGDAKELAGVMQGLSVDQVKSMMGLSQNLAQLNEHGYPAARPETIIIDN